MKRCVILVLACLIAVGALCGCGAQQPDTSLPKLLIGSDTYPPYVYMDDNGDITGLDVELAREAFRALADKEKAGVPIVAVSANAFEEDKKSAMSAGMNGHIAKPLDVKLLFRILSELTK